MSQSDKPVVLYDIDRDGAGGGGDIEMGNRVRGATMEDNSAVNATDNTLLGNYPNYSEV